MAAASRRGFLRDLARLPLIGGGVALVGNPVSAGVPLTPGMMATYVAWLDMERRYVCWGAGLPHNVVPACNPGWTFHRPEEGRPAGSINEAMRRAPLVLSAVGCRLTSAEAEADAPLPRGPFA